MRLSRFFNWMDGKWGWGCAAILAVLLLLTWLSGFNRPNAVPPSPAVAATSGSTARAAGGKQVVYIPTPAGTVTIYQDCPEVAAESKVEVVVRPSACPEPPRLMLGWNVSHPLGVSVDLTYRFGHWFVGPGIGWGFPGMIYTLRAARTF